MMKAPRSFVSVNRIRTSHVLNLHVGPGLLS
jgi:hypothetical protein